MVITPTTVPLTIPPPSRIWLPDAVQLAWLRWTRYTYAMSIQQLPKIRWAAITSRLRSTAPAWIPQSSARNVGGGPLNPDASPWYPNGYSFFMATTASTTSHWHGQRYEPLVYPHKSVEQSKGALPSMIANVPMVKSLPPPPPQHTIAIDGFVAPLTGMELQTTRTYWQKSNSGRLFKDWHSTTHFITPLEKEQAIVDWLISDMTSLEIQRPWPLQGTELIQVRRL